MSEPSESSTPPDAASAPEAEVPAVLLPGVLAPIETAIAARGSDAGDAAAPIEREDAATNRGTDADAPQ